MHHRLDFFTCTLLKLEMDILILILFLYLLIHLNISTYLGKIHQNEKG